MKRFLSILLCLIIICSIAFQCSFQSSAVVGIDDALLIAAICLDLAALGVTFANVSEFVKSEFFRDFCQSIGNDIDNGISVIKRNGKLFFASAYATWQKLTNWVKSKFSGRTETKQIQFDVSTETHPSTLTLRDGSVVPYAQWMANPFFIYKIGDGIRAIGCDGGSPGLVWGTSVLEIWCTGTGHCYRYDIEGGAWTLKWNVDMNYGLNYKGETGSYYVLNFGSAVGADQDSFYLYRTMQRTTSSGTAVETAPPENVPEVEETTTATVTAQSDATYYPGAVDAPATVIKEGEQILIEVPAEMVVGANTTNPTLTTNIDTIAQTLSTVTPADVQPKVLTNTGVQTGTIEGIITDTPVAEMQGDVNTASDIETANKFRLPKSFLEGFPFSIPYSIFVGIQSFVADPQAPVFNFPFSVPGLGISDEVEIDLSPWSPVARLCRALLSFVWVAGLAMVCSKFLKR